MADPSPDSPSMTPTGITRFLGVQADFLAEINRREGVHNASYEQFQNRYLKVLDEVGRLHGLLREKDEEIATLKGDDRDLRAEEVRADVEKHRISVKAETAAHGFDVMQDFVEALPRLVPLIAIAGRRYTTEDQSYAEALWIGVGALFHKLKAEPALVAQIQQVAPVELMELGAILQSYNDHRTHRAQQGEKL